MGRAILANSRYITTTLVMLIVAVSIYKTYLDTEAIWAPIVITFYLMRLERSSDKQQHLPYNSIPDMHLDDAGLE